MLRSPSTRSTATRSARSHARAEAREARLRQKLGAGEEAELDDEGEIPGLAGVSSGECRWSLDDVARAEMVRVAWVTDSLADREDPYAAIWHGKLGVLPLMNGDVVSIDQRPTGDPVIHLSHDDGEGHGKRMGAHFIAFIDEQSRGACAGLEEWRWMPFHRKGFGIDSHGERASTFREALGLRVP